MDSAGLLEAVAPPDSLAPPDAVAPAATVAPPVKVAPAESVAPADPVAFGSVRVVVDAVEDAGLPDAAVPRVLALCAGGLDLRQAITRYVIERALQRH